MKDFMSRIDTGLLREQRDALFTAIEDAEAYADDFESDNEVVQSVRQKQIAMLDGLVNMIDAMLDEIEVK
jgi:hypothetical protein